MRKLIKRVIVFVLVVVFLYSGYQLAGYVVDGYVSSRLNDRVKLQYEHAQILQPEQHDIEQGEVTEEQLKQQYRQRFDQLLEINSDIVGWIRIEDTGVDFPVVRTSDNDYYLRHNVEKKVSARGAIFMDYRNTSLNEDIHTVIYGHHMKDGSMFGELTRYKDASYYHDHAIVSFDGIEQPTRFEIFSVYMYSPEDQFFQYQFADEQQYSDYLEKIKQKSQYDTGVEVTTEDQLLTLVTCTYEVTDARFIVHAKRVQ